MLFPTVEFAVFYTVVFAFAWIFAAYPARWHAWLLLTSAFFYASWNARFLPLLVGLALANFALAQRIRASATLSTARRWVTLAVVLDLAVLVAFKYLGFFMATGLEVFARLGGRTTLTPVQWTLPLGVSFVTFQALSYAVDAYRARRQALASGEASKSSDRARDVVLYVMFFPHLVAGPIVRASEFIQQIRSLKVPTREQSTWAWWLITTGLLKKVVLAGYLARAIVDPVFAAPESSDAVDLAVAVYGYAIQIYADFSGYTDMAIGLAALLGVQFPANFDQPYRAHSLQSFWRRWHMTLSRWLRDYLFVSLGGSRRGLGRTARNLFLTMLLGGLWHGAAWTFVLWGALHGAGLVIERLVLATKLAETVAQRPAISLVVRVLSTVATFHVVCVGWVLFRAESVRDAWVMLSRIASRVSVASDPRRTTGWLCAVIAASLALQFVPATLAPAIAQRCARVSPVVLGMLVATCFVLADVLSPPGLPPFIYFQF